MSLAIRTALAATLGATVALTAASAALGSVQIAVDYTGPWAYALLGGTIGGFAAAELMASRGVRSLTPYLVAPAGLVGIGLLGTGLGAMMVQHAVDAAEITTQHKLAAQGSFIALHTTVMGALFASLTLLASAARIVVEAAWSRRDELGAPAGATGVAGLAVVAGTVLWNGVLGTDASFAAWLVLGAGAMLCVSATRRLFASTPWARAQVAVLATLATGAMAWAAALHDRMTLWPTILGAEPGSVVDAVGTVLAGTGAELTAPAFAVLALAAAALPLSRAALPGARDLALSAALSLGLWTGGLWSQHQLDGCIPGLLEGAVHADHRSE